MNFFQWLLCCFVLTGGNGLEASSSGSALPILPSSRSSIPSFIVMDVLRRAIELESEGKDICHMEGKEFVTFLHFYRKFLFKPNSRFARSLLV